MAASVQFKCNYALAQNHRPCSFTYFIVCVSNRNHIVIFKRFDENTTNYISAVLQLKFMAKSFDAGYIHKVQDIISLQIMKRRQREKKSMEIAVVARWTVCAS